MIFFILLTCLLENVLLQFEYIIAWLLTVLEKCKIHCLAPILYVMNTLYIF